VKSLLLIILLLSSLQVKAQVNNLLLTDSLFYQGDINTTLVKLDSLFQNNPDNADAALKLGDFYYKMSMLKDAEYFYEESVKRNSTSVRGLLGIARIDFLKGNFNSAQVLLKKVISLNSNLFSPYSILGKIYFLKNNIEQAQYYFNQSLKVDSTSVESLTNLGLIYQELGKIKLAEKYFEQAVTFNPKDQTAQINLGNFYSSIGKYHLAIITLNKALNSEPSNQKIYLSLGITYLSSRLYDEAKKYFNKTLESDVLNLDARFYLLMIDFEQKFLISAIKHADILSSLKNNYRQLHLILSNIYFLLSNTDKALEEAETEINFYPDEIEAYYMLGNLYKYSGNEKGYKEIMGTILNRFGTVMPNLSVEVNYSGSASINTLK